MQPAFIPEGICPYNASSLSIGTHCICLTQHTNSPFSKLPALSFCRNIGRYTVCYYSSGSLAKACTHTLKPTPLFNIIRWCLPGRNELRLCFTTTDQSSWIIVSYRLSDRWKCNVPYSVLGDVSNLSHLCLTLWHFQSLFCSLPNGFARNPVVATFTPKCSWYLRSVTLRQRLQICSSTIQTATITQLLRLLSFGIVRLPVVPYSTSCEITATISEGFQLLCIYFCSEVNPFCYFLIRLRSQGLQRCDFVAENLLCCRM